MRRSSSIQTRRKSGLNLPRLLAAAATASLISGSLVGAALALVVQILFGGLLGLSLPWGPALGWLGRMF